MKLTDCLDLKMPDSPTLNRALTAGGIIVGLLATGRVYGYLRLQYKRRELLEEIAESLIPSKQQVKTIKRDFIDQLESGLTQDVEVDGKHCLMLPTFITQLPDGMETGEVYAIDVGGTNFRVMHVKLSTDRSKVVSEDSTTVSIPKDIYTGPGLGLFDFFASTVKAFIDRHTEGSKELKEPPTIGFCWSFPLKQTSVNEGILMDWTKGFTCTGVVGNDPVKLLSEALERAGRPCNIKVVLNDTVGVLAAQRYLDPDTAIGVIIGTGTNACYVEQLSRLTKWAPPEGTEGLETAVNIEWGAFYSDALPRCVEDIWVDAATAHHGGCILEKLISGMFLGNVAQRILARRYIFEKLISGMFLGDVAQRILARLAEQAQLFSPWGWFSISKTVPKALSVSGSFTTADLCAIAEDRSRCLVTTGKVLSASLGIGQVPLSTRQLVQRVCLLVAERSALLLASALDALLTHMGWHDAPRKVTIAFDGGVGPSHLDGGVYEKFGLYREMLRSLLHCMIGDDTLHHINLTLVKDGSCMGAAVLAAAAAR
eukprot:gene7476-621_t